MSARSVESGLSFVHNSEFEEGYEDDEPRRNCCARCWNSDAVFRCVLSTWVVASVVLTAIAITISIWISVSAGMMDKVGVQLHVQRSIALQEANDILSDAVTGAEAVGFAANNGSALVDFAVKSDVKKLVWSAFASFQGTSVSTVDQETGDVQSYAQGTGGTYTYTGGSGLDAEGDYQQCVSRLVDNTYTGAEGGVTGTVACQMRNTTWYKSALQRHAGTLVCNGGDPTYGGPSRDGAWSISSTEGIVYGLPIVSGSTMLGAAGAAVSIARLFGLINDLSSGGADVAIYRTANMELLLSNTVPTSVAMNKARDKFVESHSNRLSAADSDSALDTNTIDVDGASHYAHWFSVKGGCGLQLTVVTAVPRATVMGSVDKLWVPALVVVAIAFPILVILSVLVGNRLTRIYVQTITKQMDAISKAQRDAEERRSGGPGQDEPMVDVGTDSYKRTPLATAITVLGKISDKLPRREREVLNNVIQQLVRASQNDGMYLPPEVLAMHAEGMDDDEVHKQTEGLFDILLPAGARPNGHKRRRSSMMLSCASMLDSVASLNYGSPEIPTMMPAVKRSKSPAVPMVAKLASPPAPAAPAPAGPRIAEMKRAVSTRSEIEEVALADSLKRDSPGDAEAKGKDDDGADGRETSRSNWMPDDPEAEAMGSPATATSPARNALKNWEPKTRDLTRSTFKAAPLVTLRDAAVDFSTWGSFDLFAFAERVDSPLASVAMLAMASGGHLVEGGAIKNPSMRALKAAEEKGADPLEGKLMVDYYVAQRFFGGVEAAYRKDIPYHTNLHGADATHGTHYFATVTLKGKISHLEQFSLILAGAVHDMAHFGFNNNFLMTTSHPLALRYNDQSVLENFHAASAFALMNQAECNLLGHLTVAKASAIRKHVIAIVLATDLAKSFDIVGRFRVTFENPETDPTAEGPKSLLLQMAMKCADVSTAAKPFRLHEIWSDRITDEFFAQGDLEKELGMPVLAFMNRDECNLPKSQQGFIQFCVKPIYDAYHTVLPEHTEECINNITKNLSTWKSKELAQSAPPASSTGAPKRLAPIKDPPKVSAPSQPTKPKKSSVVPVQ